MLCTTDTKFSRSSEPELNLSLVSDQRAYTKLTIQETYNQANAITVTVRLQVTLLLGLLFYFSERISLETPETFKQNEAKSAANLKLINMHPTVDRLSLILWLWLALE